MKWRAANIAAWAAAAAAVANMGTWVWQKPWWVADKPDPKDEQEKRDLQRRQIELEHELLEERLRNQIDRERGRHQQLAPEEPYNVAGPNHEPANYVEPVRHGEPANVEPASANIPMVHGDTSKPSTTVMLFNVSAIWDSVMRITVSILLGAGAAVFFIYEFRKEKKRKAAESCPVDKRVS